MRVLIADDEPYALRSLERALVAAGCTVVLRHSDGVSVIEWLESHPKAVDVLFLDHRMPGASGMEVVAQMPDYPCVLVTGYQEFAVDAFVHGALDYITKPIQPERLAKTLERARARIGVDHGVRARDASGEEIFLPLDQVEHFEVFDGEILAFAIQGGASVLGFRSLREIEEAFPCEDWLHPCRGVLARADMWSGRFPVEAE
jgi:DNA-binding LytR/AlgR family response regulator